jgi:receptor protein-tyrosine kinase/non-specific protein-tyrosine kinase
VIHIANSAVGNEDSELRSNLVTSPLPVGEELCRVECVEAHIRPDSRLVVYSDPYSMEADKYRTLRVYLHSLSKAKGIQSLMVTSAVMGEGKSVTALNMAVSLAERGVSKVVLVEADIRNPTVVKRLGIEARAGLSQCLCDGSDCVDSLCYINNLGIYVLSAGGVCANPIQMLNSDRFAIAMQRLRHLADWVILDCPPVMPVPDTLAIRGNVDGCLWVVKSNVTSRIVVEEAIQRIGRERLLGIILNEVETVEALYRPYYSYAPLMLRSGE